VCEEGWRLGVALAKKQREGREGATCRGATNRNVRRTRSHVRGSVGGSRRAWQHKIMTQGKPRPRGKAQHETSRIPDRFSSSLSFSLFLIAFFLVSFFTFRFYYLP
jgi:hypothetical protein